MSEKRKAAKKKVANLGVLKYKKEIKEALGEPVKKKKKKKKKANKKLASKY